MAKRATTASSTDSSEECSKPKRLKAFSTKANGGKSIDRARSVSLLQKKDDIPMTSKSQAHTVDPIMQKNFTILRQVEQNVPEVITISSSSDDSDVEFIMEITKVESLPIPQTGITSDFSMLLVRDIYENKSEDEDNEYLPILPNCHKKTKVIPAFERSETFLNHLKMFVKKIHILKNDIAIYVGKEVEEIEEENGALDSTLTNLQEEYYSYRILEDYHDEDRVNAIIYVFNTMTILMVEFFK